VGLLGIKLQEPQRIAEPAKVDGHHSLRLAVGEGYMDGMSDLLSAFTVDGFTSGATLNDLSGQFENMQIGKTMAYWFEYGDDMMPNTGDEPDFTNMTDANNNGTPDVYEDMGAFQAGIQTMGFDALNFSASVVGMACAHPQMGNMGGQLNCTDPSDPNYLTDVAADYAANIVIDANGNTAQLGDMFTGSDALNGFGAMYASNLASFGDGVQDSAFEYMTNTGFRTFDTFVNARSQYVYNMPKSDDVDFAIKTSQTTKSGVNYSLNFSNSYDKNPIIDLSWRNDAGEVLTQTVVDAPLTMATGTLDANGVPETMTIHGTYIALTDSQGMPYGGGASAGMQTDRSAILTFEQAVVRTKNLGGSFDTSVEMAGLGPVVIRGEVLYTMDGKQPVMSKTQLSVGDLVGALQMKDADRFKFVLGADVTVLTNMLISGQYISDRNIDFLDSATEYTTDYATMHLSNGFNKAIKNKQYGSLFFSKPFGNSGQHRWNNITMLEQGTGEDAYWNRFDVSWGLSDDVEGTFELNNYWGNPNTQFGQLSDASNKQAGLKYSF